MRSIFCNKNFIKYKLTYFSKAFSFSNFIAIIFFLIESMFEKLQQNLSCGRSRGWKQSATLRICVRGRTRLVCPKFCVLTFRPCACIDARDFSQSELKTACFWSIFWCRNTALSLWKQLLIDWICVRVHLRIQRNHQHMRTGVAKI